MKNKISGSFLLMIAVGIVVFAAIGGTLAYIVATSSTVTNTFESASVTTFVTDDSKIQNTGDTEAYIRAAIVVTWQDGSGNVYGRAPIYNATCTHAGSCPCDYIITLGSGWLEGNDGFYYWPSPVLSDDEDPVNCTTGVLIESCTYKANAPSGYELHVEILGSGIQSTPTNVVEENWGVTVADDGSISKN